MDVMDFVLWVLTAVALVGTYLNVHQLRLGFAFWMVSNLGMAIANAMNATYPLAFLFLVYFVLAIAGWISWGRKAKDNLAEAAAVIEVAE